MKPSTSASSPLFKPHKAHTSSDVSLLTKLRTHNADLASLMASRDGRFGLATWGQLSSSSSSDSDNNPVSLAILLAFRSARFQSAGSRREVLPRSVFAGPPEDPAPARRRQRVHIFRYTPRR